VSTTTNVLYNSLAIDFEINKSTTGAQNKESHSSLVVSKSFDTRANIDCGLGTAAWLSVAACASFFIGGILLCGCPRPDPCIGNVCCKKKETQATTKGDPDRGDDEEAPTVVPAPIVTGQEEEDPDLQDKKQEAPLEPEPEPVSVVTEESQSVSLEDDEEEPKGPDSDKQESERQEGIGAEPEPEHVLKP
jgi:hypothetical protein